MIHLLVNIRLTSANHSALFGSHLVWCRIRPTPGTFYVCIWIGKFRRSQFELAVCHDKRPTAIVRTPAHSPFAHGSLVVFAHGTLIEVCGFGLRAVHEFHFVHRKKTLSFGQVDLRNLFSFDDQTRISSSPPNRERPELRAKYSTYAMT